MIGAHVKIDLRGIERGTMSLRRNSQSPEFRGVLQRWALRYRRFLSERYARLSAGGGEWPALDDRTVARKQKQGLDNGIMRATDDLYMSLDPFVDHATGTSVQYQSLSVSVGFNDDEHSRGISFADLVGFHEERPVLVDPDDEALGDMSADATRVITELLNNV